DQPGTIIPQRTNPVSVAEFAPKTLNIRRKSYFGPLSNFTIHVSTSRANPESSQIIDSRTRSVRPSDSVRLAHPTALPTLSRRHAPYVAPAFCAYFQASFDSGTVRLADSMALAFAAVPSRMRPAMPWVMPASRNRL